MHLSRLFIKGFRSIQELELTFTVGKNVIIGRNNAGKSNIMRALDLVLGDSNPAYARSEQITESDFHSLKWADDDGEFRERQATELVIWAELERAAGEELNWEEIDKCWGYYYFGNRDRNEPTRLDIADLATDHRLIFEVTEESAGYNKIYLNPKLKNQQVFRTHLNPMTRFAFVLRAQLTEKGIEKELRFLYREKPDVGWILAFQPRIRNELIQSAILPAFRDPATQLRLSAWSWFGKLMRHLTRDCKDDEELAFALSQVQNAGDRLFLGITERIESETLSVSFPDAKLSIQFHGDTEAELYKNCGVFVDDGFKGPLTDKGAGIQSATILGLFTYYTREVNTTSSALLCVEEPELYLHPHARRVISDRLDDFIDNNRNQVIITTHGVEFLRTARGTFTLLLVRKDRVQGTLVRELDARSFLDLLINNNQNEIFFADKVILCEGLEEHVLRAAAEELYPGELDKQNVSIISVEGKDRFIRMVKVILDLGIRCYLLCDFDFLLRDPTKPPDFDVKSHPSLEQLPDEFFAQSHVGASYKGTIRIGRNRLRSEDREKFYTAKRASEFGRPQMSKFLADLRARGIGVLDGEIEDLSKDQAWIRASKKKLDLEKIYELRERLTGGAKMSDLFDLLPLSEILNVVLEKAA